MRSFALFLILTAASLLSAPATAQEKENLSPQEQTEQALKRIKELQQQRIVTLKEIVERVISQQSNGLASVDEVYEARLAVIQAELDAAAPEVSCVALYKDMLGVLKSYEQSADELRKTARADVTNYLKIKARRLEAEIRWEQAKAKEGEASR